VQNTPGWNQKTDQQTGFSTQAMMVIPLVVKDKAIGVVEVVNKKDGRAFTLEDQELLSTFAAQAAVAVENARQFTVTDQALTARVEELSVMQRIDRELNTSLDVVATMKITLEWAMRQSGAAAGVIGAVQDGALKIMAAQGYTNELEAFPNGLLLLENTPLAGVVETGSPQLIAFNEQNGTSGLLKNAANQLALPIRRESTTIGLMLIESIASHPISDENLGFLQRLGDHASVAISNAQFYAAVQAANVAKSEFVSFVAHELKNPMTSIKGYTELLAAKAVGPINDAQANFLLTIRSNIERMNTLVSDLNDVSKIEAGRLRLDFKGLPLSSAVDDIVRSTRRQVEEKTQTLLIQLPPELPMVWADRTRLAQVLVNLVSNAHKYTPAGGQIVVSAEACDNQWDSAGAHRVVHIWVQDNGIGLTPEDQKKIFTKFFRSEDPKTREVPGTGLGLNITRSLVEMQGGRIWFESEFRKGTTFHFTVPIAE
jgi:signal transduction histidine kinase